ncbi:hypothetical protein [Methylocapsa acidiphila]|uniref:hypothetical protein n=1 Tax=Methylocapsa acidiphila TaxID=133552 RepID=UPI0004278E06|nr:hypothetical protein [Methylocapsa acidiphila]
MNDDEDEPSEGPGWDPALARKLVGKYVIAGFIYLEPDGATVRERVQVHGVIVEAAAPSGFVLSLRGKRAGETMTLPPDTRAFVKAGPGKYRLKGTNELVRDPDYTSLWTITAPILH